VELALVQPDGSDTHTYMLLEAFPTKVEIEGMKAGGANGIIQAVTLRCEEIVQGS
jgi:hypothetical protein